MKKLSLFLGLVLFFLMPIFGQQVQSKSYRLLLKNLLGHTVPETSAIESAADSLATIFLDAREKREFEVSHLAGAIWVGFDDFEIGRVSNMQKNSRVVVYCSIGYRSEKIAEKLIAAGFSDVKNMVGGIFEWVNRDLPVFDAAGKTEKIHAFDHVWGIWLRRGVKVYQ